MNIGRRAFIKRIGLGAAGVGLVSSFPGCVSPQGGSLRHLPRSTPEAQGVSSAAVLEFLDAVAASKHEFHSFMMVRHGQVIAECWWKPYRANANHMLYSLSKSFTSTAAGFAVTEGMLNINAPVISFFPDEVPEGMKRDPHLQELRVKHLLMMSVGRTKDSMPVIANEQNWVRAFLSAPIEHEPGSVFLYDSGATFMVSAIVQKVTGQKVIDYLTPRLFDPLAIRGITWEVNPQGINTGGWGLSVPTEALAKFGQFYLQNGTWNGRQLLPAAWIHDATTFKIQQPAGPGKDLEHLKQTSDWHQGYCYQFWRCRHNAFRGDGAYGQFMIVMPEQDAVVAITCQTADMQGELNLVWDHLLPGIKDAPLPADAQAHAKLLNRLATRTLPVAHGWSDTPTAQKISWETFHIAPNDLGIQKVTFQLPSNPGIPGKSSGGIGQSTPASIYVQNTCVFDCRTDKGRHHIECGLGQWRDGMCDMPGTPPKLTVGNLSPCKVAASAAWTDGNTFEMIWRYYETPHHDTVTCRFDGPKVTIEFKGSLPGHKETRPILQGHL